jgi:hypothetical protein
MPVALRIQACAGGLLPALLAWALQGCWHAADPPLSCISLWQVGAAPLAARWLQQLHAGQPLAQGPDIRSLPAQHALARGPAGSCAAPLYMRMVIVHQRSHSASSQLPECSSRGCSFPPSAPALGTAAVHARVFTNEGKVLDVHAMRLIFSSCLPPL